LIQQHPLPEHVTPYDKFAWSDTEMEQLLVSGEYERDLAAYFGQHEYADLRKLAQRAASEPLADDAIRVFVVPGIMGSQLGIRREPPLPHDILWLDPIDIQVGRLTSLHLKDGAAIVPLGVVLYSYLRLKLNLRAAGFSPVLYDYDWRRGVDELGAALADRIRNEPSDRVMIVAHSMGGLVSRAALTQPGMSNVERLVLLGTPNFGSFAPLQALRGTYPVVRKISSLAGTGTPETLAGEIFNSFPSLYQMLPSAECNGCTNLFDPAEWPRTGPRPNKALLREARNIQSKLVQADERICVVVGVGQETVTAVTKRKDDFVYTITRHGDGTVPAVSAGLPGARNHYTTAAHSDLTRDPTVAAAVTDLLLTGTTQHLPSKWKSKSVVQATISDQQLRLMHRDKVDWAALEPDERRVFLENLNEPPKLELKAPANRRSTAPKRSAATTGTKSAARAQGKRAAAGAVKAAARAQGKRAAAGAVKAAARAQGKRAAAGAAKAAARVQGKRAATGAAKAAARVQGKRAAARAVKAAARVPGKRTAATTRLRESTTSRSDVRRTKSRR
jgi:pimeloyl-ACP methyl ester carboxylesterase